MPALPCCQIRMDIAMTSAASVSMSKRAPNALAIRLRRASQPSTPSRTAIDRSGNRRSCGSPLVHRLADQARDQRHYHDADRRDVIGGTEPRVRVMRSDIAERDRHPRGEHGRRLPRIQRTKLQPRANRHGYARDNEERKHARAEDARAQRLVWRMPFERSCRCNRPHCNMSRPRVSSGVTGAECTRLFSSFRDDSTLQLAVTCTTGT